MIGGTIIQKVGSAIEVLEHQSCDRCWRRLERSDEVKSGDEIWWMSHTAYLSRTENGHQVFRDKNIGKCMSCAPFGTSTPSP